MKYRKLRGALALLLVLTLFVSVCGLTAFAGEDPATADDSSSGSDEKPAATSTLGPGYDSFSHIAAIIILNHTYDARGGSVPGLGESFTYQGPMGLACRIAPAAEKEGDTFLGWKGTVNGESKTFQGRQRVHLWEAVSFTAVWASDSDVNPNEAAMKTDIRG